MNKILILDEDTTSTELISNILTRNYKNSQIFISQTTEDSLIKVKNNDFDLAILDIHLSDGTGLDVSKYIKAKTPSCAIVFLSGTRKFDVQTIVEIINEEPTAFLSKPINQISLLKVVSKIYLKQQLINENKNLQKKLQEMAYHDILTGLYNRSFFQEELRRIDIHRNYPIGIIMIDIDKLKVVNDNFGHRAGDLLLKKASSLFKKYVRGDDLVARIGGDEFVIILKKTDRKRGEQLVEKLKIEFNKFKIKNTNCSFSAGIYMLVSKKEPLRTMIKYADDDLYNHKHIKRGV